MRLKKFKNTILWTYVVSDINGEKIVRAFYETKLKKTNKNKFRIENVIKRGCDKLHVKWKGYYNFFKSLIDKKDIVI